MSTRRPEDDDDVDVDVEVASNEENAELNALRKTAENEPDSTGNESNMKVASMDVDNIEPMANSSAVQGA